jgi:thiamine biosynthesis protein ThiI
LDKIRGLGGLPVGSEGRVLMLFSGGIDSPVAAWLLMKRGCAVDFIHFHTYRTNDQVLATKIPKLVSALIPYCLTSRLILVPQYRFELASLQFPRGYRVAAFRLYMQRVAEAVATRLGSTALATGDSIGQVASQTLENLRTADASSTLLVLRPLITYNKEEIIALAKRIGTFELSITPYKDCCSLLDRHPKTRVPTREMEKLEAIIDPAGLVEESLRLAEVAGIRENEPPVPGRALELISFQEYVQGLRVRRSLGR